MPTTVEAIALLIFGFLPGYMAASVFWRNIPRSQPSDIAFALQTLRWTAVVQVLALPLTLPATRILALDPLAHIDDPVVIAAALALLLGAPALGFVLALLVRTPPGARVLARLGFSASARTPTAWDWAFRPGAEGSYVGVYLKGLTEPLYGKFGTASLAGVSPAPHDLYVQERWKIADGVFQMVPETGGMWIPGDEIEFVEFLTASGQKEAAK